MTQETDPITLYGKLLTPLKNYEEGYGIFSKIGHAQLDYDSKQPANLY